MVTTAQRVRRRLEKAKKVKKDILYPLSDSESEDERLEWIGEPLNKESLLNRKAPKDDPEQDEVNRGGLASAPSRRATRGSGLSNTPYYKGFQKGDTVYTIGDVVFLRNHQFSRKFENPHVAQILSLWETEEKEFKGDFRWFHQEEDIIKLGKHQRNGNFPETLEKGEIVYSLDDDKNDVSTIVGKCQVLSEPEWKEQSKEKQKLSGKEQFNIRFCRSMVRKMTGYHIIEWKGNEEMMKLKEEKEVRPKQQPRVPFSHSNPPLNAALTLPATPKIQSPKKVTAPPSRSKKRPKIEGSESEHEPEESQSETDEGEEDGDFESEEETKKNSQKKKRVATPKKKGAKTLSIVERRSRTQIVKAPTTQRVISAGVPKTDFEHARNRLHVKAVPDTLPCREDEFLEIQEHLESAIEEGTGSCIYISGVPGTGKTATVHEVIRSLQAKAEEGEISPFQFVEINGMKVTEPSYAYVLLWMALSDQKVTASHALQLLERQFSTPGPRRLPCVVLMDELDLLVTAKQTVMYNFFEWPNWQHSRLIVVAVANTMDLPERMLSNKVSSRLGLTRINFQPYTYQQLVKIVESRLEGIKAFKREAIEFAARKVGAVSGDARRALDICRRAVEIVESNVQKVEAQRRKAAEKNPFEDIGPAPEPEQVTIRTVDQAIKEMFASPNVRLIQTASLHQKLFLVALTSKLRRLGLAEVEFSEVAHAHLQMCRLHNIEPPMLSDLAAICASLGSSRCLLVESGKQDIHQRVRLSVSEEDIPEIVTNVSMFIPLWSLRRSSEGDSYVFSPKDLLSCCLVSQMWRHAMLPALWHTYDEAPLKKGHFNIPVETLTRYAPLFRIVNMRRCGSHGSGGWLENILDLHLATMISELTLGSDRFVYNFNLLSPKMRLLDIETDGGKDDPDYIMTDIAPMLSSLSCLVNLRLRKYTLSNSQVVTIFKAKPSLRILELYCTNIWDIVQLQEDAFKSLIHLRLEYCNIAQETLESMFKAMPSLESLEWLISKMNIDEFDSLTMGNVIRDSCPKLKSLHLSLLFGGEISGSHFTNLISCQSDQLKEISLKTNQLWPTTLGDTLARRCDTIARLSIQFARPLNKYEYLVDLLGKLSRLQVFGISGPRNAFEFKHVLQKHFNSCDGKMSSWIDEDLRDEVNEIDACTSLIFRPLPTNWNLKKSARARNDCAPKIQLFDFWLLQRAHPLVQIQEIHINGSEYVRKLGNY
ncbi:Origin recognition complex, subunit 1 [Mortierella sp. AD010]|nr:Origin recognition complex, subunit 1 [Mortierella sp. AD010]